MSRAFQFRSCSSSMWQPRAETKTVRTNPAASISGPSVSHQTTHSAPDGHGFIDLSGSGRGQDTFQRPSNPRTMTTMELASMSRAVARRVVSKASYARYYSIVHDVPRTAAGLSPTPPPPQPQSRSVFEEAVNATGPRTNWTKDEITQIHQTPLMELAFAAVSQPVFVCGPRILYM